MAGIQGGDSVNTAKRKEKQKEIAKLHEKTFRAWINKQLKSKNLHINNLFEDLEDGIMLIQILETLSHKTCPSKPTPHPKMEIQKLENITMGLEFAKTIFPVSMIQSKDILEAQKNPKLLLGLVWQMILHFQVLGEQDSADKKTQVEKQRGAKEKLLKWCQDQTKGHKNVEVTDLTVKSWGDGMGFCALVHAYNPSLIDYDNLDPANKKENLKKAFELAEKHMDIPPFLDADDILSDNQPDEQCFITYLSEFPLAFLNKAQNDLKNKDMHDAEAKRQEEERRKEEERKAHEEKVRAEEDAKRKAEEDRRKAEEDAKRKHDELEAEAERQRRAAEEAKRLQEETERKAREAEEAREREKAERKARKAQEKADADRLSAEETAKRKAEAEAAAAEEERKRREFEAELERMKRENEAIRNQLEGVKRKLIGKIKVTVVEARGLPKSDHMSSKSDPYCVLFLERQKEKTRTVKKTLNPKWQADFEFYVSETGASLEVSVFDWNRLFADELMGKVTIPVSSLKDGVTEDKWYPLAGKEKKEKKKDQNIGEIRLTVTYNLEK